MMKAPHNEELPYSYCKLVEVSLKGSFANAVHQQSNDVDDYRIANDYCIYCTHSYYSSIVSM